MDLQGSKSRQSSRGYVTLLAFVCFALAGAFLVSSAFLGSADRIAAPMNQVSAEGFAVAAVN